MSVQQEYFSIGGTATLLGMSRATVRRMMHSGELAYTVRKPRMKRIPRWAIQEWEKNHLVRRPGDLKRVMDGRRKP